MPPLPKTYLITGCSSGLGYALALAALAAGHHVIATSRRPANTPDKVARVRAQGGQWAALDVSSPTLEADFQHAILPLLPLLPGSGGGEGGGTGTGNLVLDVLINNAGVGDGALVEDLDDDLSSSRAVFETNVWGLVRLTRLVVPLLRSHQGDGSGSGSGGVGGGGRGGRGRGKSIVNISSATALQPLPFLSIYAASKGAVDAFTASLAAEVAPFGIRVVLVTPGGIRTAFVEKALLAGGANASASDSYDDGSAEVEEAGRQKQQQKEDRQEAVRVGVEVVGGLKPEYRGTPAEAVLAHLREPANFRVDPDKAARVIVAAVDDGDEEEDDEDEEQDKQVRGGSFVRLLLGAEALGAVEARVEELRGAVGGRRAGAIARGVDVGGE